MSIYTIIYSDTQYITIDDIRQMLTVYKNCYHIEWNRTGIHQDDIQLRIRYPDEYRKSGDMVFYIDI